VKYEESNLHRFCRRVVGGFYGVNLKVLHGGDWGDFF
jgi:hypothetical protein